MTYIALTLLLQAGIAAIAAPVSLEQLEAAFEQVCVVPKTIMEQRSAATALKGSSKMAPTDHEPPASAFYDTGPLMAGVIDNPKGKNCFVGGTVVTDATLAQLNAMVTARLGAAAKLKIGKTGYGSGWWSQADRTFSMELGDQGGRRVALLSVSHKGQ